MTLPAVQFPLTIWHKPHHWGYHRENSKRGIAHAAAVGATAIDIDCQATRDRVIIATHWPKPLQHGFVDPARFTHHGADVAGMTLERVQRLRTPGDGYRIWTAAELLDQCARHRITPCFEVKDDHRFEDPAIYEQLVEASRTTGVAIVISTMPHLGGRGRGYRRLEAAKRAGLTTMLLTGGSPLQRGRVPAREWQWIDLAKGSFANLGRPSGVLRLGPGSKYGQEVGDRSAARITRRLRKRWAA